MDFKEICVFSLLCFTLQIALLSASVSVTKDATAKYQMLPTPIKSPNDHNGYKLAKLSNGMTVMAVQTKTLQTPRICLCIDMKTLTDENALRYSPYFLPYLLFITTKKYPTEEQLYQFFKDNPEEVLMTSSNGSSLLLLSPPAHELEAALDRLGASLTSPLFKKSKKVHDRLIFFYEKALKKLTFEGLINKICLKFASAHHPLFLMEEGWTKIRNDENVHKRFEYFYQNHFSAHLLTLTVLGNEDPDCLIEMVSEKFQNVPVSKSASEAKNNSPSNNSPSNNSPSNNPPSNNPPKQRTTKVGTGSRRSKKLKDSIQSQSYTQINQRSNDEHPNHPFNPNQIGTLTTVYAENEADSLVLVWQITAFTPCHHYSHIHYVNYLIQCPEKLGLLNYLIGKNLAIKCKSFGKKFRETNLHFLQIYLTKKGQQEYLTVAKIALAYLSLIRDAPEQSWVYKRMEALLGEKYESSNDPVNFIINLTRNIQIFPHERILKGIFWFNEADHEVTKRFLSQLKTENLQLVLFSKQAKVPVKLQRDELLCVFYGRHKISASVCRELQQVEASSFPDLALPGAIQLLATNGKASSGTDLVKNVFPIPLIPDVLWEQKTHNSSSIQNQLSILLQSPSIPSDHKNQILAKMLAGAFRCIIERKLASFKNEISLIQCTWSVEGLSLMFSGSPEYLILCTRLILIQIFHFVPDENLFATLQANFWHELKTFDKIPSYAKVDYLLDSQLFSFMTPFEYMIALREIKITLQEFVAFSRHFFTNEIGLKILATGNVKSEELFQIVEFIWNLLKKNRETFDNFHSEDGNQNEKQPVKIGDEISSDYETFHKTSATVTNLLQQMKDHCAEDNSLIQQQLQRLHHQMGILQGMMKDTLGSIEKSKNLYHSMIQQFNSSARLISKGVENEMKQNLLPNSSSESRNSLEIFSDTASNNELESQKSNFISFSTTLRLKNYTENEVLFYMHHKEENAVVGIVFHCSYYNVKTSLLLQLYELCFKERFLALSKRFQFEEKVNLRSCEKYNSVCLMITASSKTKNCFFIEMVLRNFIKQTFVYAKESSKFKNDFPSRIQELTGKLKRGIEDNPMGQHFISWYQIVYGKLEFDYLHKEIEALASINMTDFLAFIEDFLLPNGKNLKYFSLLAFHPERINTDQFKAYGSLEKRTELKR